MLAAGVIEDLDIYNLTSSYAALSGVQHDQVTVTVSSASVRLVFSIRVQSESDADHLVTTLGAQTTESLSSALGVSIAAVQHVIIASYSLQPPASPPDAPQVFSLGAGSLSLVSDSSELTAGVLGIIVSCGCLVGVLSLCIVARWRTRRWMTEKNLGRLAIKRAQVNDEASALRGRLQLRRTKEACAMISTTSVQ